MMLDAVRKSAKQAMAGKQVKAEHAGGQNRQPRSGKDVQIVARGSESRNIVYI